MKKSSGAKIFIFIALLVVGVGVGFWFWNKKQKEKKAAETLDKSKAENLNKPSDKVLGPGTPSKWAGDEALAPGDNDTGTDNDLINLVRLFNTPDALIGSNLKFKDAASSGWTYELTNAKTPDGQTYYEPGVFRKELAVLYNAPASPAELGFLTENTTSTAAEKEAARKAIVFDDKDLILRSTLFRKLNATTIGDKAATDLWKFASTKKADGTYPTWNEILTEINKKGRTDAGYFMDNEGIKSIAANAPDPYA